MSATAIERARGEACTALGLLYSELRQRGYAAPDRPDGQLIRPLLSIAGAEAIGRRRDDSFWAAAAAVQFAHEASLMHDDVIDGADVRRGAPTLAASRGTAAALVEGDHLLTTSYRLAAVTGSSPFAGVFAHAVERTVAGEKMQGRARGMTLDEPAYRRIIAGKSGELLGCALAAAAHLDGAPVASSLYGLGRRIGELYQMLDDLLDYLPDVDTGKPSLGDYAARRWTWPLLELDVHHFEIDAAIAADRFTDADEQGSSPLRRCLARFGREVDAVRAAIAVNSPADSILSGLVEGWRTQAADAVTRVEAAVARRAAVAELTRRVPDAGSVAQFFSANSRTFSFAARTFPRGFRERIARLYAFCRVTDDIADGATPGFTSVAARTVLLDVWRDLAREAHSGALCGIPLIDDVMREAALAGVPFRYVAELIEGMRMDLRGERYATLRDLHVYSYRVAGVIGQWMTRLCGVHDPAVLARAADLGHAMQLTNIARDVGEDLRAGRVYLPADMLAEAGLEDRHLRAFLSGDPVTPQYIALIESLMARADEFYASALSAVHALPPSVRRTIVIAAHVYRGIHDELRANGYDNFNRRAHTGAAAKVTLALRALSRGAPGAPVQAPQPVHRSRRRQVGTAVLAALAIGSAASDVRAQRPDAATQNVRAQRADPAPAAHTALSDRASASAVLAQLDTVRSLFFRAVDDAAAVRSGHAAIDAMRPAAAPDTPEASLLRAYEGAFTALEAKHGTWPIARHLAVRNALRLLDEAAVAAPANLEIRYLRMINGYHLPSIFGRSALVAEDMAALTHRLPTAVHEYPAHIYRAMAEFIIAHGAPDDAKRAALHEALRNLDTAARDMNGGHHE